MNLRNAGRLQEPTCDEFIERHSEYLDNALTPMETARLAMHAQACESCARYDRVLRRSQSILTRLHDIEPSADFEQRLQHRIFHLEDASALAQPRVAAGTAAAFAIAATLALLAWTPFLLQSVAPPAQLAQPLVSAPPSPDPLFTGAAPWYPAPVRAPAPIATLASFPGPHSPLVVTPPLHRQGARAAAPAPID